MSMGKVTIALTLVSTTTLLVAFGKGIGVLRGADVTAHFQWATAALFAVLAANLVAIIHAAQSDRIIRELRRSVEASQTGDAGGH
jgi:hypothetical protein